MASTFTPNVQLEEPARGDDVGTWDTPVNANTTNIDLIVGAIATISLNNTNVVLSAAQFRSKQLTFISTLTGSVTITFPTSFTKTYEIQNLCTGSSAFVITLGTTSGGQAICPPPGEVVDCFNDGANIKFKNFGRVGTYWDYAGSSVPNWISGCSLAPYLVCNGATFSATNYPALASILGSTTLPDQRGRARYMLDQGVGRVSSAGSNVAGNTLFAGGGDQALSAHGHGVNDPGHFHTTPIPSPVVAFAGGGLLANAGNVTTGSNSDVKVTGISIVAAGTGGAQNMPPLLVSGITMIRSA